MTFSEWLKNRHKELGIKQPFQEWWLELPISHVVAYIEIYNYHRSITP